MRFNVTNPYNGKVIGDVHITTPEELERYVKKAHSFQLDLSTRKPILKKAYSLLKKRKRLYANLITCESGLCIKQTLHEVDRSLEVLKACIKMIDYVSNPYPFKDTEIISEPLDLVVAITPFNHPLNQIVHKIGPAIVAGTSMILKPSQKTPLTAIKFRELLTEAGLPKEFLYVVNSNNPKKLVDILIKHHLVDSIMFTGGTEVGNYIEENKKPYKKYIAELGGNAALVVLEDADLELASRVALGAFDNSGQRCTAINSILVHKKVADKFVKKFLEKTKKLKWGNPMNPNTDIGTVINEKAANRIKEKIMNSVDGIMKIVYFDYGFKASIPPIILDRVDPDCELIQEETFGPIAPIVRINNIDDAVRIINKSGYKLAGAVITKDKKKAKYIADRIKVGQFNWNGKPGNRTEMAPFGGFGKSGNGEKEGVYFASLGMRRIRTFYEN